MVAEAVFHMGLIPFQLDAVRVRSQRPAGRFGMVQMRHHFAGAAATGDPAEIVGGVFFLQAGVGHQGAEAVRRHAARDAGGDGVLCRRR